MAVLAVLRRAAGVALDAVLPPRCLKCGAVVDGDGLLCAACWPAVSFLAEPLCARCGISFPYPVEGRAECAACLAEPPAFDAARAVFVYDDASRPLVLGFKHGDQLHAAPGFARWLARAGAAVIGEADLIVPVPLHWTRLFRRRFNQAAVLANALARLTGLPAAPDLLRRRRRTSSQGLLGRRARARNVAGAFALRPGGEAKVAGRAVLLLDDVLTSGATANACAAVLRRAGARKIFILTLARAVISDDL